MRHTKTGIPRPRKQTLLMLPLIAEKSKLHDGFAPLDGRAISPNFHRVCRRLVAEGLIYAGRVSTAKVHYFDSAQAALDFVARNQKPPKPVKVKAVKPPKAAKVRPVKAAKPPAPKPVAAKPVAPKVVKSVGKIEFKCPPWAPLKRQPWMPKPLAKSAEIIWPDDVKRTSRPFVDLRAVTVPFLRIGTPGFSMSIGGAA